MILSISITTTVAVVLFLANAVATVAAYEAASVAAIVAARAGTVPEHDTSLLTKRGFTHSLLLKTLKKIDRDISGTSTGTCPLGLF